jgi:pilus assembly protein Flp/PilA
VLARPRLRVDHRWQDLPVAEKRTLVDRSGIRLAFNVVIGSLQILLGECCAPIGLVPEWSGLSLRALSTVVVFVSITKERKRRMSKLVKRVKKFFGKGEEGASMVEYGIMVSLIAAICVAIVTTLGTQVKTAFTTVSNSL